MKNLYLLPTDKPSRLIIQNGNRLIIGVLDYSIIENRQHIYITSDKEIKEGDWIFSIKTNNLFKADSIEFLESHNMIEDFDKSFYINSKYAKKIILTTDQELIKDGVQVIDDDFLNWFIKNPSCEEVEVNHFGTCCGNQLIAQCINCTKYNPVYKIIIPKKATNKTHYLDELPNMDRDILAKMWESAVPKLEPKQETLEQTAVEWLEKKFYFTNGQLIDIDFEQAKEMEKNNLNIARLDGINLANKGYGK